MKPKALVLIIAGLAVLVAAGWFAISSVMSPGAITIATYNADEQLVGASEDLLSSVAQALRSTDADVLAIQGVESEQAVRDFVANHLADMGYEHIVSLDVGHEDGTENAVLSRFPILNVRAFADQTFEGEHPKQAGDRNNPFAGSPLRFRQSPLLVELDIPGERLTILTIDHKGGNRFSYWREAEARATVALAQKHARNKRVLILGSFHAENDSPMYQVYDENGFRDPLSDREESDGFVTESAGDRTDFILCRKEMLRSINPDDAFVVELSLPNGEDAHYPLAVRYKPAG